MSANSMTELKLVFAGPMGAGKTTAIAAISQIEPLCTEVANTDLVQPNKATTTVALDYGELTLQTGEKLKIFGTPGQERFNFMWRDVAVGALGLVVLLDCSRPDPVADLKTCLRGFPELVASKRLIVGLGRLKHSGLLQWTDIVAALSEEGVSCPVISVDVRLRTDVLLLIDVLLHALNAEGHFA